MEISDLNRSKGRRYNVFERLFLLCIKNNFNHIVEFYNDNNLISGFVIKNSAKFKQILVKKHNVFGDLAIFKRDIRAHGFHISFKGNSIILSKDKPISTIFLEVMKFDYVTPTTKFKNFIKENKDFIQEEIKRVENELNEKIENARCLLEFSVSKT